MRSKAMIAVIVLVFAVGVVLALKRERKTIPVPVNTLSAQTRTPIPTEPMTGLPRLVDLGSKQCIPCKLMAPILERLRSEYQGTLDVAFIDVRENPDAGKQYGIRIIPTLIFFDAAGNELYRNEEFMSEEDIIRKCQELGIRLEKEESDAGNN
ncbi:MAG TPA: thioredoxin domain-containing protein [bacterium]|nr:thioredoxin domain-containing protein [bacterium]HQL60706.1 thioredoxin domain-containing protein [bacterium]